MKSLGYEAPTPPEGAEVVDLMPTSTRGTVREPAPDERVLCINRSTEPIVDMYDARPITLPPTVYFSDGAVKPGLFWIPYAVALHIQRHQIVPGTKSLVNGTWQSYIGIRNVDADELCEPFTPEQMAEFGLRYEAIDRSADDYLGLGGEVKIVPTTAVRATSPTLGVGGRSRRAVDASQQATPGAAAAAEDVVVGTTETGQPIRKTRVLAERPATSDTRVAAQEAAAVGGSRSRGR